MDSINAYDFDGTVLVNGAKMLLPDWHDVIITGRGYHEIGKTLILLRKLDLGNQIFFFPGTEEEKNNRSMAEHKARIIGEIKLSGIRVNYFFEDVPEQVEILRKLVNTDETKIIHINHAKI